MGSAFQNPPPHPALSPLHLPSPQALDPRPQNLGPHQTPVCTHTHNPVCTHTHTNSSCAHTHTQSPCAHAHNLCTHTHSPCAHIIPVCTHTIPCAHTHSHARTHNPCVRTHTIHVHTHNPHVRAHTPHEHACTHTHTTPSILTWLLSGASVVIAAGWHPPGAAPCRGTQRDTVGRAGRRPGTPNSLVSGTARGTGAHAPWAGPGAGADPWRPRRPPLTHRSPASARTPGSPPGPR